VTDDIVGVGDPVGCGSDIRVNQGPDLLGVESKIVLDEVFGLASRFNKVVVPEYIIAHIELDLQETYCVHRDHPCEGLVHSVS